MGGLLSCRPIFSVLCHLAICEVTHGFTQPHFHPIFLCLLWVSSYGGYIAFSLWQKDFKHIFLLNKIWPHKSSKIECFKNYFLRLLWVLYKMRGRNNTTSHLWLFHLRLHFNQTLSYKFVHSVFLIRATITLLQELDHICHTIANYLWTNFVIHQFTSATR